MLRAPGTGWMQERLLGIAHQRRLPAFARQPFLAWWRTAQPPAGVGAAGALVLFPDTWTLYSEPAIAQAAVRVLWAAGYQVLLPTRPICCGRPLLSKGLLDGALSLARQQLAWLAPYAEAGLPIVGLEPSCILSFRDEYPDLLADQRALALARQTLTFEEFVAREIAAGRWHLPLAGLPQPLLVHQHCHAKALAAAGSTLAALRSIPAAEIRELDAGCCGMAGSFGYEREHYDLSLAIGERALLPAVRAAPDALIVAPGTSCRQQIAHATERHALHPAQVLALALGEIG